MKHPKKVRLVVAIGGQTIYKAQFTPVGDSTAIEADLPEDKRMHPELMALLLMCAQGLDIPIWMKAKLLSVLGALGAVDPKDLTASEYKKLIRSGSVEQPEDTKDIPF